MSDRAKCWRPGRQLLSIRFRERGRQRAAYIACFPAVIKCWCLTLEKAVAEGGKERMTIYREHEGGGKERESWRRKAKREGEDIRSISRC